ncbi:hypothetical protein F4553_000953 [Allocatelliglobosispora scoriae]|uniref:Uncharacterized protein n=1 Tax=Allocatelliglobosispora scoriae TaxID=643052 RepID=A0A841BH13_9ACTN|nr:hypothetical protein [Allocatelliglobosispora scoriae]MBB5867574.1 hypothetical protein [Allocatelliglobosispora scoriae]
MSGTSAADGVLVTELARTMLERVVAVETDQAAARVIFPQQAEAYLADPARALAGRDRRGRPLEFGLTGVEVLLVPVLMEAAVEVLGYLTGHALLRGGAASAAVLRRLFGRPAVAPADAPTDPEPEPEPVLTPAQWAEVARIVESVLVRHARMTPERAERLAIAVVGAGVLGKGDHGPR